MFYYLLSIMCADVHLSVCQWRPAQDISFDILGDQKAVSDSLVLFPGAGVTGSYGHWELRHWSYARAANTLNPLSHPSSPTSMAFLKKNKSNHRKAIIIFYQSPDTHLSPTLQHLLLLPGNRAACPRPYSLYAPTHKHPVSLILIYAFCGPDTQGPSDSSLRNFAQLSRCLSIWTLFSFSWSFCLVLMKVLLCFPGCLQIIGLK